MSPRSLFPAPVARAHLAFAIVAALPLLACSSRKPSGVGGTAPYRAIEEWTPRATASAAPDVTDSPDSSSPPDASIPVSTSGPLTFAEAVDVSDFQKGNIHTHSSKSDGHASPQDMYLWYRDHGYAFVALTDHNQLTPPEQYATIERKGFVMIPGEEITMSVRGIPVHVNALCSTKAIGVVPDHALEAFPSVQEAIHWAVKAVLSQGAVALINHPNFVWAFGADALPAGDGAQLLEMWSGHPAVHSDGDANHPSEETIWDTALTRGETFAGVAVDDTHYLDAMGGAKWPARPGRGWVEVFGAETTKAAICDGLARGRLYASSGARFRRIRIEHDVFSVWPREAVHVDFIGQNGAVLDSQEAKAGAEASYHLKGTERYVRARITTPRGKHAWTQAYRTTP